MTSTGNTPMDNRVRDAGNGAPVGATASERDDSNTSVRRAGREPAPSPTSEPEATSSQADLICYGRSIADIGGNCAACHHGLDYHVVTVTNKVKCFHQAAVLYTNESGQYVGDHRCTCLNFATTK